MDPVKTQRQTHLVSTTVRQTIVIRESSAPDAASPEVADAGGGTVNLGPDDLVIQNHVLTPRNVDVERACLVPDLDWEVGRPRSRSTKAPAAPRS